MKTKYPMAEALISRFIKEQEDPANPQMKAAQDFVVPTPGTPGSENPSDSFEPSENDDEVEDDSVTEGVLSDTLRKYRGSILSRAKKNGYTEIEVGFDSSFDAEKFADAVQKGIKSKTVLGKLNSTSILYKKQGKYVVMVDPEDQDLKDLE